MKKILVVLAALIFWAPLSFADDEIGIFETILESSASFSDTNTALEQAIVGSQLQLHGTHVITVQGGKHQARLYVLTSPDFLDAAAGESPRTASAQLMRIAVFTSGDQQSTFVNMANPVPHAMIFFAESENYHALVNAAGDVAKQMRDLVRTLPGNVISVQTAPLRKEKNIAASTVMALPR